MKKILLMFTLALCILFSACTFLYAPPTFDHIIYKVTKIGLSYINATNPEVEIPLSEVFDFQLGLNTSYLASDKVMYRGDIPDGTITGVWVYAAEMNFYSGETLTGQNTQYNTWIDCRTGQANISIAVGEGESAKIIIDYSNIGYAVTKEAL